MSKGVEAKLSMICTHTGISDTAKAHFLSNQMNYSVVYTAAAKGAAIENSSLGYRFHTHFQIQACISYRCYGRTRLHDSSYILLGGCRIYIRT